MSFSMSAMMLLVLLLQHVLPRPVLAAGHWLLTMLVGLAFK